MLRERAQLLEEAHQVVPSRVRARRRLQPVEQLLQKGRVLLEREHHLHVVEEHDGREGAERCVVQHPGQDDVLEVPNAVRLVDLSANRRVLNRDNLLEHDAVPKERAMLNLLLRADTRPLPRIANPVSTRFLRFAVLGIVLERTHDIEDVLVPEQLVKQVGVVEQHQAPHQGVHHVQRLHVVQILARLEQV